VKASGLAVLLLSLPSISALLAADFTPLDVKPGLWQVTTGTGEVTTQGTGAPTMPAMPSIPPEVLSRMPAQQRAQLESMMKGRGAAPPAETKVCFTKESLQNAASFGRTQKGCTYQVTNSSASKQQVHVDCQPSSGVTSGDMTIERSDAEHVKGDVTMKSPQLPQPLHMSFSYAWLSSDCGDVKPASPK